MKTKKKHWATETSNRASCGARLNSESLRVTTVDECCAADNDGTLCRRCRKSATDENTPF